MTSPETTAWTYDASPQPEPRRDRRLLALFGSCVLIGAVLAPIAGWVWVTVANPPKGLVAPNGGLYLGEQALNQQSEVTLWFFVVGAAFGALAGLVVGRFGQRVGWPTVFAVLVLCAVGSVGSRYLGIHLFGTDPRSAFAHATVGAAIQMNVQVDTWVAYLGWPIGGLLGALAAIVTWSRSEIPPQAPPSPTLYTPA